MNETKKKLLAEIDRKIAQKKEAAVRAAERNTIDAMVIAFIEDVEYINNVNIVPEEEKWGSLYPEAQKALERKLQSVDPRCTFDIHWNRENEKAPQVSGVLIKWSTYHQHKYQVEPELFVDMMSLLFKD